MHVMHACIVRVSCHVARRVEHVHACMAVLPRCCQGTWLCRGVFGGRKKINVAFGFPYKISSKVTGRIDLGAVNPNLIARANFLDFTIASSRRPRDLLERRNYEPLLHHGTHRRRSGLCTGLAYKRHPADFPGA